MTLVLASLAFAAKPPPLPFEDPRPAGSWIADGAGLLSTAGRDRIDARIDAVHASRGPEIVVVTVNTIPPSAKSTAELATTVLTTWGVGRPREAQGVVLLVAVAERRIEMKVGAGLKVALPEAMIKRLRTERLDPLIQRRSWADAIEGGVDWTVARLEDELEPLAAGAPPPAPQPDAGRSLVMALAVVGGLAAATFASLRALGWFQRPVCPSCGRRSVVRTTQVLLEPTAETDGTEAIQERCASCRWQRQTNEILPRLPYIDPLDRESPAEVGAAVRGAPPDTSSDEERAR